MSLPEVEAPRSDREEKEEKGKDVLEKLRGITHKKKTLLEDEQALRNRIRHLKYEVSKTHKKVVETEERAEEIRAMKERAIKQREERKQSQSATYGQNSERSKELKKQQEEAREKLLKARAEKAEQARKEAERLRKERLDIKKKTRLIKEEEEKKTKLRVQKRKEEIARKQQEDERMKAAQEKRKLDDVKRALVELRTHNRQLNGDIERLERAEKVWIGKLKSVLEEQRDVFRELEQELAVDDANGVKNSEKM